MIAELAAAGVLGVGSLVAAQCAPAPPPPPPGVAPDCSRQDRNGDGGYEQGISNAGTSVTCTFDLTRQRAIGEVYVWVEALCEGGGWVNQDGRWGHNMDTTGAQTQTETAHCNGRKVIGSNPRSKHS